MPFKNNSFNIILNSSRAFGGYEELTSPSDLEVWIGISEIYSHIIVSTHPEEEIEISIDWSSAVSYATKCKELYSKSREDVMRILKSTPDFFEHAIICQANVQFKKYKYDLAPWAGGDYLHQILYEIFLVANLSSPGCFNLYRSYIRVPSLDPEKEPLAQTELELSEYMFEMAWHDAKDAPWVKVGFIPFQEVIQWYRRLELGFRQVAHLNVEKVLFALLHLGRRSFLEPEATLWIASALEAIFDTPHGNSFQFLHKRITNFLSLNEKQQGIMRKRLREFYDVRNSFAHGGGAVCHPIANECWDPEISKVSERIRDMNDFASMLLIGSMQELIRRNIVGIEFSEVMSNIHFKDNLQ